MSSNDEPDDNMVVFINDLFDIESS
jgi:hypothetical protein